jgi:hypothetical protein
MRTQHPPTPYPPRTRVGCAQAGDARPPERDRKCQVDLPRILLPPEEGNVIYASSALGNIKVVAALTRLVARPGCSNTHLHSPRSGRPINSSLPLDSGPGSQQSKIQNGLHGGARSHQMEEGDKFGSHASLSSMSLSHALAHLVSLPINISTRPLQISAFGLPYLHPHSALRASFAICFRPSASILRQSIQISFSLSDVDGFFTT